MTKIITALIFVLCAVGIGAMVLFPIPWNPIKKQYTPEQPRIVIPRNLSFDDIGDQAEHLAREDSMTAWAELEEGETIISVLTGYFDGGPVETQFVAYRNLLEIESPIYLTFIDYDLEARGYRRLWSAPTAATRPGTIRLYTLDLIGDRSVCVLLSGMNGFGEHTLTVFRLTEDGFFNRIVELRIDGTIAVREIERNQAYQSGQSQGQSFTISAFGRDFESSNILDQIETVYAYNAGNNYYEQRNIIRIPGMEVEQRRVGELLGNSRLFEEFITGLWFYITPRGAINKNQFIYFDPPNREIIFYGDETQQVFNWRNSARTRYGLYLSTQNISVNSLGRSIDIELESLESIRVRVIENVSLRIGVDAPWNGSYKKADPLENRFEHPSAINSHVDAFYDGSIGRLHLQKDGTYELTFGASVIQGKYAFFNFIDEEMLELRPGGGSATSREIYLIEGEKTVPPRKTMTMYQVRIGARGLEKLNERPVSLTLTSE